MWLRDREWLSGCFITGVGVAVTLYCLANYPLGTFDDVGPGMFPVIMGAFMCVCGLPSIFSTHSERGATLSKIELRPLAAVLAGISACALFIQPFGLIPASTALVFITGMGRKGFDLLHLAFLSAALAIFTSVIFIGLLKVPMELLTWPF